MAVCAAPAVDAVLELLQQEVATKRFGLPYGLRAEGNADNAALRSFDWISAGNRAVLHCGGGSPRSPKCLGSGAWGGASRRNPRRTDPRISHAPHHRNRITPAQADLHQQEIEPSAIVIEAGKTEVAADPPAAPIAEPTIAVTTPKIPTGKLAGVIEHIGRAEGASIDELAAATNWQPHTIRAVLSRLRRRVHLVVLSTDAGGRKAYRLERKEG